METEYERKREEMAILLFGKHGSSCGWLGSNAKQGDLLSIWNKVPQYERDEWLEEATQILSLKGIRIEADNQDLPDIFDNKTTAQFPVRKDAYTIQRDMLTPDKDGNVWVKVKEVK